MKRRTAPKYLTDAESLIPASRLRDARDHEEAATSSQFAHRLVRSVNEAVDGLTLPGPEAERALLKEIYTRAVFLLMELVGLDMKAEATEWAQTLNGLLMLRDLPFLPVNLELQLSSSTSVVPSRLPQDVPAQARDVEDGLVALWNLLVNFPHEWGNVEKVFFWGVAVGVAQASYLERTNDRLTVLGAARTKQVREWGRRRWFEREKGPRHAKWLEVARRIQANQVKCGRKPLSKTELARLVKRWLDLDESPQTIRDALKNQDI